MTLITWTYTHEFIWAKAKKHCSSRILQTLRVLPKSMSDAIEDAMEGEGDEDDIGPDNEMAFLRELLKRAKAHQKDVDAIMDNMGIQRAEEVTVEPMKKTDRNGPMVVEYVEDISGDKLA